MTQDKASKVQVKFIPDDEDVETKELFDTSSLKLMQDLNRFLNKVRDDKDVANKTFEHSSGFITADVQNESDSKNLAVIRVGVITQFDQSILYSYTKVN